MKIDRRGQEEITGFVLIVVLVSVVLVIILGIMLRSGVSEGRESRDVYQFMESALRYTTDCATNYGGAYYTLGDLVDVCDSSAGCVDGRTGCEAFNKTFSNMLEISWKAGANRSIKGYVWQIDYGANDSKRKIMGGGKGVCNSSFVGSSYPIKENMDISLRVCS